MDLALCYQRLAASAREAAASAEAAVAAPYLARLPAEQASNFDPSAVGKREASAT